jgi:DNA-binding MarR family transcriptional regulator
MGKQKLPNGQRAIQIDTVEDIDVAWARRQDSIRGILKQLRIVIASVQRHAELSTQLANVSATQLWMLWELGRAPGLRVLDLAKLLAIHVSSAECAASDLEAAGWICARAVTGDQPSSRRLTLTESGKQRLERVSIPARGMVASALDQLDDQRLDALAESLLPLVAALQFKDAGAALSPLDAMFQGNSVTRPVH